MSAELPQLTRAHSAASPRGVQGAVRALLRDVRALRDRRRSRVLVVALVVSASAGLARQQSVSTADLPLDNEISPTPVAPVRCRAQGEQALAQARLLEQLASASWERVPFEPRESPRAVVQVAEAEACFAAARDRTGRLRTAALFYRYSADLERRFARARLLLRIALRSVEGHKDEPLDRGHHAASQIPRQIAALLALLERAPSEAQAYRSELQRLAGRFHSEWPETDNPMEAPVIHVRPQPRSAP